MSTENIPKACRELGQEIQDLENEKIEKLKELSYLKMKRKELYCCSEDFFVSEYRNCMERIETLEEKIENLEASIRDRKIERTDLQRQSRNKRSEII